MKLNIVITLMVILLFCLLFGGVLLSGCSLLPRPSSDTSMFTGTPPTPGVQLWQAAKKSNWLVTVSILGIAGGVFALVNGSAKLGTATVAATSVSLFMALAVARFAFWIAVCGVVGSITAVLFSILVRRKALVEIITGVQVHRKEGLGSLTNLNLELNKQSTTTKKIVNNIKNELKLKGKI